jgi:tetratricopeptide (TPR) repeat protein
LVAAEEHLAANPPRLVLALPLLVNVMKRKPKHMDTRINLANLYSEMGMPGKAVKHIKKLIKLTTHKGSSTELSSAHYMLAKHYLRHKDSQVDIIEALRLALNADPTNDNAKHWLAHQLSRSPNGEREAAALLSSIQLDKLTDNHPLDSLMLLGQATERLGQLDGALDAFRQACALYRSFLPSVVLLLYLPL